MAKRLVLSSGIGNHSVWTRWTPKNYGAIGAKAGYRTSITDHATRYSNWKELGPVKSEAQAREQHRVAVDRVVAYQLDCIGKQVEVLKAAASRQPDEKYSEEG
jgi:hypothetical protein